MDLLEKFCEYTKNSPSPEIFRKWAGMWMINGILERKVWIDTAAEPLYPNLYVLFIASPGVGKGKAFNPMVEILERTKKVNLAPASVSAKGLLDYMVESCGKSLQTEKRRIKYHSALVVAPELGVLTPGNDPTMMSILCDLYDCGPHFKERIRGRTENLVIKNPHVHLLAGTQPKFLKNLLPDDAYEQGITARIIMVYADEIVKVKLFTAQKPRPNLKNELVDDMRGLSKIHGPFNIEEDAIEAIELWHLSGKDKGPTHSKLQHYCTRRIMHLLKLSMGFSVARLEGDMTIKLIDWEKSLELLRDAEAVMPEIFKSISSGGQAAEIEEAFMFVMEISRRTGKPVPEYLLINFLADRVPSYQIEGLIDVMLKAQIFKTKPGINLPGERHLIPQTLKRVEY